MRTKYPHPSLKKNTLICTKAIHKNSVFLSLRPIRNRDEIERNIHQFGNDQRVTAEALMAKFIKGVSRNPKGRPKGSGKLQRQRRAAERQYIINERFRLALDEIAAWHKRRIESIDEFSLGSDRFPLHLDD